MIVQNLAVFNLDGALTGMRNPKESWHLRDSTTTVPMDELDPNWNKENFILGTEDRRLAQTLILAGSDHRKFMRQILVSMNINASMSAWWDLDTYKVATEKNSTSRMHKLVVKHLSQQDFNWTHMTAHRADTLIHLNHLILKLEQMRNNPETSKIEYDAIFEELINDLPQGFTFWRHWTANYEVLRKIYFARKNHKQRELREFCEVIETLPYSRELICYTGGSERFIER